MVIPSVALLALLLGLLGFAIYAARRTVAEMGVTSLRLSLWRLHDELVDGIVAGDFKDPDAALALRSMVRVAIQHARDFTVWKVFGTFAFLRLGGGLSLLDRVERGEHSVLTDELKDEALIDLRKQFVQTMARYVFRTSVLGWFSMLVVPLAYALWRVFSGSRPDRLLDDPEYLAKRPVQTEWDVEALMARLARPGTPTQGDKPMASSAC